ncbi:MAG: hypothetical protein J6T19_06500 [Paludibacteraceae bacterium]|nr:hypothetical protein [Paludibacteraceae bacterium]
MFNPTKHQFEAIAAIILLVIVALALLLSSCNVTRTVTTTAQTIQRGDTTTVIMTKTIESYDGKVDASKLLQAGQAASGL